MKNDVESIRLSIVEMYFAERMTPLEIAKKLKKSKQYICKTLREEKQYNDEKKNALLKRKSAYRKGMKRSVGCIMRLSLSLRRYVRC